MNLVERVKSILTTPQKEFETINGEAGNAASITTTFLVPLVLIGTIASFIGYGFIGISWGFGVRFHSVSFGLKMAIGYGIGAILTTYIVAFVIDALAPNFGAEKNFDASFKAAAYTQTASLVAAVFNIIPSLGLLALIGGIYSLYLLYVGLPIFKKSPEDKKMTYFLVVLGVSIATFFLIGYIINSLFYPSYSMGSISIG